MSLREGCGGGFFNGGGGKLACVVRIQIFAAQEKRKVLRFRLRKDEKKKGRVPDDGKGSTFR